LVLSKHGPSARVGGGPTAGIGKSVTLKSLFPGPIVTVRVSGFQPESGIWTVTMWSPSATLMFIGVGFPVFTPSTITWAPDGKDVTFNVPAAAGVTPIMDATRKTIAIVTVRMETPIVACIFSSSQRGVSSRCRRENDPAISLTHKRVASQAMPHASSPASSRVAPHGTAFPGRDVRLSEIA
jgi:hypothetical protein